MADPARRLAPGEELVLDLHPSGRRLVVPFVAVPVLAGLVTFALLRPVPSPARGLVLAAAAVLLVVLSVAPYLRWRATRYLVTTRRVLGRSGVLRRVRDDIALGRVDDLRSEYTLLGRLLRAGDLVLESDSPQGGLRLVDVPRVEQVAAVVASLLEDDGGDEEEDEEEDEDEDDVSDRPAFLRGAHLVDAAPRGARRRR